MAEQGEGQKTDIAGRMEKDGSVVKRTIETVLHLLMAHFGLSEAEAQAKIDEYFEIVDMIDEDRKKAERENK